MTKQWGPAEEVLLKHLKDANVKTIVLTGEAGVGKTRMANEINNWALQEDGFCLGTLWVFPSPGDKHNWKSCWLSIAHQLSIVSTTEEWEDHSTVDENITVDGEKKESEETEKLRDDSIIDEKVEKEDSMKKKISVKLEKMIDEEKKRKETKEKNEMWLLILDGVPEEKDENEMMKNLNGLLPEKKGVFKFLITTTKKVIETESDKKVFKIEPMSEDDSLSLLNEKVKGKVRDHPDFETISKEIAKRSKGRLPAVILMMAEALNHIKEDDFDSGVRMLKGALEEPEGVNPLLGYVYDMLACTDMALINCCWQSKQLFQNFGGINYEELIACWILEGYVGVNDQFDKAYEEGHCVLMELINRCILKLREDGLVTMEGLALTVPDEYCHGCRTSSLGLASVPDDHCHGRGTSRLGLARILEYGKELGIGRVASGEGMIKTPYGPKNWNKVCTLMIDGSRLSGEVLDTMFLQHMEELKVLAIFNPRFKSLPSFLFPKTKTDEPSSKPKTDDPIPKPKTDDPIPKTGLRLLVLRGCDQLDNIDQIKNLKDLIVLEISGASSLKEIPDDFFQNMKQLESLNLSAVPVQSLPSSLSKLTKLRRLILKGCSELEELPNIKAFTDLEVVDLSGSTSLKKIKDKCLKQLQKLQMLDLSHTQINHLPILKDLKALTRLILKNCKSITRLSRFELLSSLHNLGLSGSTILKQIHDDSFKKKDGLKVLDLSESGICSLPSSFTHLPALESLDLSGVSNLVKIPPNTFVDMACLRSLNLSNTKIEELPSISKLGNLRQLLLSNCPLKKLPETRGLTRLEKLDLSNASSLVKFEDESFDHLTNLCYLNFSNTQIKSLPSIANVKKLCQLLLQNCEHLSELPSLDALEQLEELDLSVKETENKSSQSSREPLAEPLKETETKSPVKETEKKPSGSSGPSTEPLKETEAKSPVKEMEKKPSESAGEPSVEPLKETEAKSPIKETEKKPSESSGEPSAPVKATEKKPSESSGEPSAEQLKETEAAKSSVKETEKKSSETSREPSKETEAKLPTKETEKKSSGSYGDPLAEPLKEAKLEKMVHLRLLNLSGTKLKIKIPLMSNLTSLTNLTELCLGGCKLSNTDPSLKTYTKLKLLDLSKTDIQSLPSLENLTDLRGLKLRGCTKLQQLPNLKSLKDLESLDLQETGVKEFPYWISELTHLKHLDLPDLKDLQTLDWGMIKNLPEELNWDHCGIFKFNEKRPCMSLSGTQFFQYLKENSELWKTYFKEFKFSVCALTKEGKVSRIEKKKDKASIQQKKEDKGSIQEKKENKVSSPENKDDKASSREKKEDKASSREKKQDKSSSQEKKEDKASGQEKKENKASEKEKKDDKTSSEEKKKEDKTSSAEKKEDKASCKEKKEDKSRDICWHRVDSNFRKIYFQTHSFPENISKYLEIIGFDEYPGGVEDVLMKAENVSLIENDFVKSLSNLGVGNLKAMKGCWLERCNEMETIFCREEAEVEMQRNLNILWASNLPELESVYSGEMQHGSLLNLTELYLDCCPMLEVVFPSSQLPENLKILEVKFCDELKTLFMPTKVEEYEQRNLQKLHLVELPKLTSIGVLEGSNNKKRFPSLKVIKVRECPNLQQYFGTVLELGGSVENSKIEEY
uniref:Disease resistance protein At4g27190-like leucine-rich repeats domain-containing protein n=2 Tax=Quercus lobata TaxID=97700 RepID=A0A7N2N2U9_QUELO